MSSKKTTKSKGKPFLKALGKNSLAFLTGAIIGLVVSIIYTISALPSVAEKAGLAIIALIPVLFILYGILGIVIGGSLGIIVYQVIRIIKNK